MVSGGHILFHRKSMQKLLENSQLNPSGSQTLNSRFSFRKKETQLIFFWRKKTLSFRLVEKTPTGAKDKKRHKRLTHWNAMQSRCSNDYLIGELLMTEFRTE